MEKNTVVEQFYNDNFESLVKRVSSRVPNKEDAEDVVHDAFERALKYFDSFDPSVRKIDIWFSRILSNALKDFQNREKLSGMHVELKEWELEPAEDDRAYDEAHEEILNLIQEKDGNRKEILTLYFMYEYLPREISEVLDVKVTTVRQYVWQFREELKETIGV